MKAPPHHPVHPRPTRPARLVAVVSLPVHWLGERLHGRTRLSKRDARFVVGLAFMAAGIGLQLLTEHWKVSHAVRVTIDLTAGGVHGLGCAPFANVVVRFFALE